MSAALGMLQGFMVADHAVPVGMLVVHQKFCEECGVNMYVENGNRYCPQCSPFNDKLFNDLMRRELERALRNLWLT